MIKKLLPLIAVAVFYFQTGKSQSCNFILGENISNVSASHITSVITCATYSVQYTIKNTGSSLTSPVTLAINLPDGIIIDSAGYHYTTSNGDTLVHSFANTSIPYFIVQGSSNWNTGDSVTIYFSLRTPCCLPATNSMATSVSVDAGLCTATTGTAVTVVAPVLSAACIYPSSHAIVAENTGSVVDFVFEIKNAGIYPINQYVNTICPNESSLLMLGYFYSTTQDTTTDLNGNFCSYYKPSNFVSWNDTLITADTSVYHSLFGVGYFPVDSMYLHIIYEVVGCNMTSTPDTFQLFCSDGSGSASCFPGVNVTSSISVLAGFPHVNALLMQPVYIDSGAASYCNGGLPSVRFGLKYVNQGADQGNGAKNNGRAEKLKLFFYSSNELGKVDTSSLEINGYHYAWPVGFVTKLPDINYYWNPLGFTLWQVDFSKWAWNCGNPLPFGNNSVADLDGNGYLDDLSDSTGQDTITLTINFIYQPESNLAYTAPFCPATFLQYCGKTSDNPLYGYATYQNECNSTTDTSGVGNGYFYGVVSGGTAQLNLLSGHDVVAGTTSYFQVCTEMNTQSWSDTGYSFICAHPDHRVVMNLPAGYNVDFSDPSINAFHRLVSYVYMTSPCGCPKDSIQPLVTQVTHGCDTNQAIIDFGLLPKCDCGSGYYTYNLSCFTIPISLNCNSCTNSSRGWDNISYSLDYYCDTSTCLSCASPITCASNVAFHHCAGGCAGTGNDFNSYQPFTFERYNLGWKNTPASAYYDECNHPLLPSDTVSRADTSIHLDRAYPGDEILAADSGTLDDSLSHYGTIIFQMDYTVAYWLGSFADTSIFAFDSSKSSITVISANHKVSVLTYPTLQHPADGILSDGKVQMSFTFSADTITDTALKGMAPPYSFLARIYLIAKTKPVIGSFPLVPSFFQYGIYPLNDLQAEFRGTYDTNSDDTDNSCDPWTANFEMLQPGNSINIYGNGSAADGYTSACYQLYENLRVTYTPALYPAPDFPNEFHPYMVLDNNFRLIYPSGYSYDSANFMMVQDVYDTAGINNFTPSNSVVNNYYPLSPIIHGDTLTFNGPNGNCFPYMDYRPNGAGSSVYFITAYYSPNCNAPDTSYFEALTGCTTAIQQTDTAYQNHYFDTMRDEILRSNPIFSLSIPSTAELCTDSITFTITLNNTSGTTNAPYAWVALEQTNILSPPITFVRASNAIYYDTYGPSNMFIMLDSINSGGYRTIQVTVKVDTIGCSDTATYPINIAYGNVCSNSPEITQPNTLSGCDMGEVGYTIKLFNSSLSLNQVDSMFVDTLFCGNFLKYTFEMSNFGGNTLYQPSFLTNLPPGVTLDSAVFKYPDFITGTYYRFTADDSSHTTGNLIWDFANDALGLTNGLPGYCHSSSDSNNDVLATIYLSTNCNFSNSTAPIIFSTNGIAPCGKIIYSDGISDKPYIPTSNCPKDTMYSTNDSCYGECDGTAYVTARYGRPPYTYLWMPGSSTSDTITGLCAGTYTVTVTDNKGCSLVDFAIILQPKPLSIKIKLLSGINCSGGGATVSAFVQGGTYPYKYSWSPIGITTDTATGLSAGTYTVTVKDTNGCTIMDSITITQPLPIVLTFVGDTISCGSDSGFATVNITNGVPPFTYSWSNGDTTASVSGLIVGSYTVVVTDSNHCKAMDTLTVTGCSGCWTKNKYDLTITNQTSTSLTSLHGYVACEDILVIGTFTVDSNFTFDDCNVAFAPGAMINVIQKSILTITNNIPCRNGLGCPHLYAACTQMWRGIFVYPGSAVEMYKDGLVEDADSAVVSINSGTAQGIYQLSGFVFNRNYKDIVVRPTNFTFTGFSSGCVYTCRNLDTVPACDAINEYYLEPFDTIFMPFVNKRTQIGWDIDSVGQFIDMGGNTFDNMVRGIYALKTNLTICTDLFMHINAKSDTDAAIYDKGAIILGGNKLVVGGTGGNANTFEDCTTGIYANSEFQYVYVADNVFHDRIPPSNFAPVTIGVLTRGPMVPAFRAMIDSNVIDSARFGVVGSLNQFGKFQIEYNRILGGGRCVPDQEQGIRLNELSGAGIQYHVEYNSIGDMHYGIYGNNLSYPIIYQDTIALGGDMFCALPLSGRGITLSNNLQPSIVDNTVSLPFHSNPLDYINKHFFGIYVEDSKNSQVLCNTTYYLDTAIACNGGGDMGSSGNPFEVLGNHMTAGPNTLNSTGIEIAGGAALGPQGSPSLTSDNEWMDTTNFTCRSKVPIPSIRTASPFYIRTGSVYDPDAGSCVPYIAFFTPITLNHYNCSSVPPLTSTGAILDSIATNQITYLQNPDTSSRIAKSALTTILWNNDSLLSTPLFHHFNDSINGVSLGQLMAIDTILSSTSAYDAPTLLSTVNAITPASNVEANIQATQQVYLQAQIASSDTLPQINLIAMRNLANLCPDFDGYGVYQARALLDYYDTTFTIYDNDNCVNDDNRDRFVRNNHGGNNDTTKNVTFNLYPNPNNGSFTIEYDLGSETSGTVEIYNQVGMKVAEYLLPSPSGKMFISNPDLSQSVYIYKLYSDSGVKKIGKIVIVR